MIEKSDYYTTITYKGIIYYDNFLVPYEPFCYIIDGKSFLEEDDIKHYIDKTLLRQKKLERIKGI